MPEIQNSTVKSRLEDRRHRLVVEVSGGGDSYLTGLLREVDVALARLALGTFGVCEACHDPIEQPRLAADPLVRVCLACLGPAERQALEYDLELAARIQRELLPDRSIVHGGWETHYHYEPLGAVSGDHCDVIQPQGPGGDLFFLLGDVSGKGISASILMAHVHAAFRSLVHFDLPLAQIMRRANHLLMSSTPSSAFVAMISGRLSPDGRMEISNAGHLAPLLRRGREIQAIKSHGMPLGMFTRGEFSTVSLDLNPGDLLFLFTEGAAAVLPRRSGSAWTIWRSSAGPFRPPTT
jgi:sigma-B regulation protein RsbU (phosphoserine phosphatase)